MCVFARCLVRAPINEAAKKSAIYQIELRLGWSKRLFDFAAFYNLLDVLHYFHERGYPVDAVRHKQVVQLPTTLRAGQLEHLVYYTHGELNHFLEILREYNPCMRAQADAVDILKLYKEWDIGHLLIRDMYGEQPIHHAARCDALNALLILISSGPHIASCTSFINR